MSFEKFDFIDGENLREIEDETSSEHTENFSIDCWLFAAFPSRQYSWRDGSDRSLSWRYVWYFMHAEIYVKIIWIGYFSQKTKRVKSFANFKRKRKESFSPHVFSVFPDVFGIHFWVYFPVSLQVYFPMSFFWRLFSASKREVFLKLLRRIFTHFRNIFKVI